MCQLTLIDLQDIRLAKFITRPLTELNTVGVSTQSNNDGFGYVCFNNLNNIIKTEESAQIWWDKNQNEWKQKHRNPNGLFHVRNCSQGKDKEGPKHAHPFINENIIQIHNGTLNLRFWGNEVQELKKLIDNKKIDSENFLQTIQYFVKNDKHLTSKHLEATLKNWDGTFAIMLVDKRNPTKILIAKDDVKKLHKCIIKNGKIKEGIIINTEFFELEYVTNILVKFAEALNIKLTYEIEELSDLKIWEYTIGSYELKAPVKTIERPKVVSGAKSKEEDKWNGSSYHNAAPAYVQPKPESVSQLITTSATRLDLSYLDITVLAEILFKKNIFVLDNEEMLSFAQFLESLQKTFKDNATKPIWEKATKNTLRTQLYQQTDIFFPYILNKKSYLQRELDKWENTNQQG